LHREVRESGGLSLQAGNVAFVERVRADSAVAGDPHEPPVRLISAARRSDGNGPVVTE
jgi:hypothetical protein